MRVTAEKKAARRRTLSLLLALSMVLPLICAVPAAAAPKTEVLERSYAAPNDQVLSSVERLAELDILRGDPDGGLYPDRVLKRSEFAAMVNRAYGFTKSGPTPFTDVPETAWYANDIGIAYNAGYFKGTLPTTASPEAELTRQDTVLLLARNMRLDEVPGQIIELSDGDEVSHYAMGHVRAMAQAGLIDDNGGNGFRPHDPITRGEMAQLLLNCVGTPVREGGEQILGDVAGNMTISAPGTVLRDTTIAGDLYISGGIGSKGVTLENVDVLGRVVVAGGGEAEDGTDSVILRNVEAEDLLVDNISGEYLSLRAEGDTSIADALFKSGAFILDRTPDGYGLLDIKLDSASPASFTLSGNINDATNLTPGSTLNVAQGTIKDLVIDQDAAGSTLNISNDATVRKLSLDTGVPIAGTGDIDDLQVNTEGSSVESLPDRVSVRPGLTANVAGTEMDSKAAAESSTDPRLLAGYPKMKNVAPTSATAVFSTNKAGTVYWAVSAAADGSVGESELIEPLTYGSKALKQGNLRAATSNTEITAAISGLTKGGTFYLSAVMVDARGIHSPVKVISFNTPDDTVPAFTTTPKIIRVGKDIGRVQVAATTNKSCVLHYALMSKDAAALTVNDFKTNAFTGNYGHGTVTMTRNVTEYINVNSRTLAEQTDYFLYLWLVDADGVKSSGITRLPVKTGDETPPVITKDFEFTTSDNNSISGTVTVNEAGSVFWAAVKAGTPYPTQLGTTGALDPTSRAAKIIVENDCTSPWRVSAAQANKSITVRATKLEPENAYDIYYVAKDTAGNYSDVVKVATDLRTKDGTAPQVSQDFTKKNISGSPYLDTDIQIVFTENVVETNTNQVLLTLFEKSQTDAAFQTQLAEALANTIHLYDAATGKEIQAGEGAIDYGAAQVTRNPSTGAVTVTFPASALSLSGKRTYQFRITNIADLSGNELKNSNTSGGVTPLPSFKPVTAEVDLVAEESFYPGAMQIVDPNGAAIESDAGFNIVPVSTVTADPDLYYDVLIWSNTSVTFDVYFRINRGTLERPVYDNDSTQGWNRIGSQSQQLNIPQGTESFISVGKRFNGNSFSLVNSLYHDQIVQYGIHITNLNGPDRSSWSTAEPIRFGYTVVAGTFNNLNNLTAGSYNDALRKGDIIDISGTCNQSIRFESQVAPHFLEHYPIIRTTKDSATIQLKTNNPAKVYWALVPVTTETDAGGNIINAYANANAVAADATLNYGNAANGSVKFERVPTGGSDVVNSTGRPLFKLSSPTQDQMMPGDAVSATSYVHYCTQPVELKTKGAMLEITPTGVGSTVKDAKLAGLERGRWYYAYFMLESDGGARSEVYVYKFFVDPLERPNIHATGDSETSVFIKSRTLEDVSLDYYLIWNEKIDQVGNGILQGTLDDYPYHTANYATTCPPAYRTYTLAKAMETQIEIGGEMRSVFDHFVNPEGQRFMAQQLGAVSDTNDFIRPKRDRTLRPAGLSISDLNAAPDGFPGFMKNNATYIFIAVAYNEMGYSFSKCGTFENTDKDVYKITSAALSPNDDGSLTIRLYFGNRTLYDKYNGTVYKVTLLDIIDAATVSASTGTKYLSVSSNLGPTPGEFEPDLRETTDYEETDGVTDYSTNYLQFTCKNVSAREFIIPFTRQITNSEGTGTASVAGKGFTVTIHVTGTKDDKWAGSTVTIAPSEVDGRAG